MLRVLLRGACAAQRQSSRVGVLRLEVTRVRWVTVEAIGGIRDWAESTTRAWRLDRRQRLGRLFDKTCIRDVQVSLASGPNPADYHSIKSLKSDRAR